MKRKNKKYFTIIALVLLVAAGAIGYTYARYVSVATGTGSARVAKFAFDLNGANASTTTQTMSISDLFSYTYNNGTVVGANSEKTVAPGTSGYIEILLQNQGEVAIVPDWTITETNASNVPLQYQVSTSTTPNASNWSNAGALAPTETTVAIDGQQKYYLHWKWATASDANDTTLGVAGTATVSIKIDCTVSQYIPE